MNEDWLEKAIQDAVARGDFDDLPGTGSRIEGLGAAYDPAWWAKRFVGREEAREAGIELVAQIDRSLPSLLARGTLDEVIAAVEQWNAGLAAVNRRLESTDRIHEIDREDVERRWHALRR